MITRLWLRCWKAYDSVDLDLGPGTTFLVADNGVGKSSIVQALHFAFFGYPVGLGARSPVSHAVRGPEGTEATVGCQVSLGGKSIHIERLIKKLAVKATISTSIAIDGQPVSENDWREFLRLETGVDATQLALLSFVPEGQTISVSDAGVTIVSMLSEVFGVERLRGLSKELESRAKRIDRETDELRRNLRDMPSRHQADQRLALEKRAESLKARIQQARHRIAEAERIQRIKLAWTAYLADQQRHVRALEVERESVKELLHRIRDFLPEIDIATEALGTRENIRDALRRISVRRDQVMMDRGRIEAERDAALRYIEILRSAEPICPVCRRPMSDEDAANAIGEHEESASSRLDELSKYSNELENLERIARDLSQLISTPELRAPTPPEEPAPTDDVFNSEDSVEVQQADLHSLESQAREADAQLAALEQLDKERQQNTALTNRLLEGYRAVERAHLAAATMSQLADTICAERISPLASELEKRWPQFSMGTSLSMDPLGALALTEGEYKIPYSELSGGQRTLVQIVVRLLALQMATRSPFLVLDEPLEHLDPRNRRSLATLLVQATQTSTRLRQVLVTTYEESVTRRLSSAPIHGDSAPVHADGFGARVVRIASS